MLARQVSRVRRLAADHSSVGAERGVELTPADIDREHLCRAACEEDLSETAGGRAYVHANPSGRNYTERIERCRKLDAAAGHPLVGRRDIHNCVFRQQVRWLPNENAIREHAARLDRSLRLGATLSQTPGHQQKVGAHPHHDACLPTDAAQHKKRRAPGMTQGHRGLA